MSYTALYRKYRPETFDDVKGQEHVVTTLRNQIIADRLSHAYLFTGSRGTGKTSVAKIFARAVNCENPQNGNPCNECETCRTILSGASLNAIEIDAASNNGVDNIRQIREEVAYPPTQGRYKVYVIDEVHMLSAGAFNALLKTLEEPPSYVIFILATTEVQKIPVTILSRCQRYDFHRISREEITLRLRELLEKEQIEAEEQALRYIAGKAEGGMRDALSLADRCISFYLGQPLTYERVLNVLGAVDVQVLGDLFESIAVGDVADVFKRLDEMIFKGREVTQLVTDMTEYLRDLLLVKTSADAGEILDTTPENFRLLEERAALAQPEDLLRFIRIFSELSGQMHRATARRTLLEVALIKMCRPAMQTDVDALSARVRALEEMIESGALTLGGGGGLGQAGGSFTGGYSPTGAAAPEGTIAGAGEGDGEMTAASRPRIYHKAAPEDLQQVEKSWGAIVGMMDSHLDAMTLKTSVRKYDAADPAEDVLYVICRGIAGKRVFSDENMEARLEDLIEERIGKRIHVRIMDEVQLSKTSGQVFSDVREAAQRRVGVPIEIVPDE